MSELFNDKSIQFIIEHLPEDISIEYLMTFGNKEWWKTNPANAIEYALRKCPLFNWQAYAMSYPDVHEANIDLIYHYLKYGIYEGRSIKSWHPARINKIIKDDCPKITVIVPNFNNAIFLRKCLNSLVNQTFSDIEIIVVDDGSKDDSLSIIHSYLQNDSRIKLISLPKNMSLHMARKAGVAAASGDYVMFLDADDTYQLNACEIAWHNAIKGYDIVSFDVNIINIARLTQREASEAALWFNSTKDGIYPGEMLLRMAFLERSMHYTLTNKIIDRHLMQDAFSELEDGYFPLMEDLYEFMPIALKARHMLKINERLYNYTRGVGGSSFQPTDTKIMRRREMGKIIMPIQRFCKANGLDVYFNAIKRRVFVSSASPLPMLPDKWIDSYYNALCKQFGLIYTVRELERMYRNNWDAISKKFIFFHFPKHRRIKHVGILHDRLTAGGIESTISNLCSSLTAKGYDITLYLIEKDDNDIQIENVVDIIYLSSISKNANGCQQHLMDIYNSIINDPIDVMYIMIMERPEMLWYIMLLHFMDIPVIGASRINPAISMLARWWTKYPISSVLNTAKCLDKVTCLSTSSEIVLRAHGIDAEYIPNGIRSLGPWTNAKKVDNKIAVLCRLGGMFKQTGSCLQVLYKIIQKVHDAKMIFIGDFGNLEYEREFFKKVAELKLNSNIIVTGNVHNPAHFLDKSKLMISTSMLEGFPNSISEAQSRGLPVVMFKLDIELAKDNESIIMVEQNDIAAMADEICKLLRDDIYRQRLAAIALDKSKKYSNENLAENYDLFFRNFQTNSTLKYYTQKDYLTATRDLAFYAGKADKDYTFLANLAKTRAN